MELKFVVHLSSSIMVNLATSLCMYRNIALVLNAIFEFGFPWSWYGSGASSRNCWDSYVKWISKIVYY